MSGCAKLENLSTQFFMIQIMRHLLLESMHVCMLRLWESRISAITQTRNAFQRGCMPLSASVIPTRPPDHLLIVREDKCRVSTYLLQLYVLSAVEHSAVSMMTHR